MSKPDHLLEQIRAEHEIQSVILRYIRANDRLQYDDLAEAYHPDAYDDHGTYKGGIPGLIEWIKERHRTIEQSMHLSASPLITLEGDHAWTETYCVLVQHERSGCVSLATRQPAYLRFTFGLRYVDRFERRQNVWKIARRIVVWEWAQEDVGSLAMDPSWVTAKRSRDDAIYRTQ